MHINRQMHISRQRNRQTKLATLIAAAAIVCILSFSIPGYCQSMDKNAFDEINIYESQFSNGKLYLRWYSVGSKPAPLFKTLRYDNGKPSEVSALTALYKDKDTTFYVFSDEKPAPILPDGATQYFIVPHDTLMISGKPSAACMIVPTGGRYFSKATATRQPNISGIRVAWAFSSTKYISRFELLRSAVRESGYSVHAILNATDTLFTDTKIIPDKVYYYQLRAIPTEGNKPVYSSRFFGTGYNPVPPVAPIIMHAHGIKNGAVLHVRVADPEATGVRIYRNSPNDSVLVAVTDLLPVPDSMVVVAYDTISRLSGRALYTYAATTESSSFVQSGMSDKVDIQPLNTLPPQAPLQLTAYENEGSVSLYWGIPVTDSNYIVKYLIDRLEGSLLSPVATISMQTGVNHYTDSTAQAGKVYTYKIRSVGYDGLVSADAAVATVTLNDNIALPAAPFALNAYPTNEGMYLEWSETRYSGLSAVRVYRSTGDNKPERIAELPPSATTYNDQSVKMQPNAIAANAIEWVYYITTVDAAGQESEPSEEVYIDL